MGIRWRNRDGYGVWGCIAGSVGILCMAFFSMMGRDISILGRTEVSFVLMAMRECLTDRDFSISRLLLRT